MPFTVQITLKNQAGQIKFDRDIEVTRGTLADLVDAVASQSPGLITPGKPYETIGVAIESHLHSLLESHEKATSDANVIAQGAARRASVNRTTRTNASS